MMKLTTNGNGLTNGNSHESDSMRVDPTALPAPALNAGRTDSVSGSEPLSQTQHDDILRLLSQVRGLLPFLQDLTVEERRSLAGMGDRNRAFTGTVLAVVQQNSDFLPRAFDVDQFQQDVTTFDRLATILMALNQLRDLVDATTIALGSQAYDNALVAYRHAKACDQGASLDAMMADMAQRFTRKSKRKEGGQA